MDFIRFMVFTGRKRQKASGFLKQFCKKGLVFIDTSVKTGLKMKGLKNDLPQILQKCLKIGGEVNSPLLPFPGNNVPASAASSLRAAVS